MKHSLLNILTISITLTLIIPNLYAGYSTELFVGGGYNECLRDDDTTCSNIDPSVGFFIAPGIRLHKHIGINLDINLGFFDLEYTSSEDNYYSLQIMPVVRGYLPLNNKVQVFGGIGLGYSRTKLTYHYNIPINIPNMDDSIDYEYTWYSFLALKINGGIYYTLSKKMKLGVMIDYIFNDEGKFETKSNYNEYEYEPDDVLDNFHFNIFAKFAI